MYRHQRVKHGACPRRGNWVPVLPNTWPDHLQASWTIESPQQTRQVKAHIESAQSRVIKTEPRSESPSIEFPPRRPIDFPANQHVEFAHPVESAASRPIEYPMLLSDLPT